PTGVEELAAELHAAREAAHDHVQLLAVQAAHLEAGAVDGHVQAHVERELGLAPCDAPRGSVGTPAADGRPAAQRERARRGVEPHRGTRSVAEAQARAVQPERSVDALAAADALEADVAGATRELRRVLERTHAPFRRR